MLLEADPDAYFFPRLYLSSPRWWDAQHPDDLVTFDPGDGRPQPFFHGLPDKRVPSWARKPWRRRTRPPPCGDSSNTCGSRPMPTAWWVITWPSGTTEEWMMWGGNEQQWVDFSPVNVARFRQWLRDIRHGPTGLQQAWADPTATFDSAAIPTRRQRETTALATLRDPRSERPVIDFYDYNADLVADTIAELARVVKEATQRKSWWACSTATSCSSAASTASRTPAIRPCSKCGTAPTSISSPARPGYAFRTPGTGYSHFMSLTGSVRLHGKLWFDENNIRTWLLDAE